MCTHTHTHMQGVSSYWWNYRHFQHHAKPNVVGAASMLQEETLSIFIAYSFLSHAVFKGPRYHHVLCVHGGESYSWEGTCTIGLPLPLYLADLGTRLVCPKTLARSVTLSFSLSLQWGRKHWGKLPYHLQHRYFFLGKTSTPHHRPSCHLCHHRTHF